MLQTLEKNLCCLKEIDMQPTLIMNLDKISWHLRQPDGCRYLISGVGFSNLIMVSYKRNEEVKGYLMGFGYTERM